MLETDLYLPLKTWFENQGFEVRGEVNHCDLVAQRGDDLVVVELKLKPSLKLLYQAADRLQITDEVYIGLPAPTKQRKALKAFQKLLGKLGVGLLLIHTSSIGHRVEQALPPSVVPHRRSRRKALALTKEFSGRGQTDNLGGAASIKILTVYREDALLIFAFLENLTIASPKQLIALGCAARAGQILRDNHYDWFERVKRGHYALKPSASAAVTATFPEVLKRCRAICQDAVVAAP
jgi:hypothetical protein|tara:strand:- start:23646 stop:24353 length:708 start_codon:yes stop_codon:yes gene_type:complete